MPVLDVCMTANSILLLNIYIQPNIFVFKNGNVPSKILFVGFEPEAEKSRVHHMMLVGCDAPVDMTLVDNNNVWNCGGSLSEPGQNYRRYHLTNFFVSKFQIPNPPGLA